jgi:hypothetical protein
LGVLYVATGLFFGDRIGPDGRFVSGPSIPPWLLALAAVIVYALLSFAWDKFCEHDRKADLRP